MATDKLELTRYEVSRWTAFAWTSDTTRKEGEAFLERAARIIENELRRLCPKYTPAVARVQVSDAPQLKVTLTLPADDGEEAMERLEYYVSRALTSKTVRVSSGGSRAVQLRPPWGREEATRLG